MENALPSEFDLIIVGTGLAESIISAAASRVGKRVLHVDTNDYYGGQWASCNLKSLYDVITQQTKDCEIGDSILHFGNDIFNIKDFHPNWHIPEKCNTNDSSCKEEIHNNQTEIETTIIENVSTCHEVEHEQNLKRTKEQSIDSKVYSQEVMLQYSRKFNIDLIPKLHFARGEFVQLLITSNIARYAEYRSVSRVLTWVNNKLEVVPCSRSDVFANNRVSVIEKRMLMKLLTSLNEENEDFKSNDKTFFEFLKEKKLTENLIHFVLYAISQSSQTTPCNVGIDNTKRFLNSLGRFGKTPFLFSMYGSGETTQAFCRLSAVFGGIFALNRKVLGLKIESNKVAKLLCESQEISSEHFVFGTEKAPKEFIKHLTVTSYISRAILITDSSIMPSEQEHLTILMYPPENGKNIVTILELGALTGTCPKDFFLVHLTARQDKNPEEDFKHIVDNLFRFNDHSVDTKKPNVLWSCYFSLPDMNDLNLKEATPSNMFITSGPDLDLDYDLTIKRAKDIFNLIYPDLEFLPRAPDPEEIIFGGDEEKENTLADEGSGSV